MKAQIPLALLPNDFTTIQAMAVAERRKPTEVMRNLLEDVMDGKVDLSEPAPKKESRHATAIRVDEAFKVRFDKFKEDHGLSAEKVLHLALAKLRTGQDLLDGIDALTKKHRQSNQTEKQE